MGAFRSSNEKRGPPLQSDWSIFCTSLTCCFYLSSSLPISLIQGNFWQDTGQGLEPKVMGLCGPSPQGYTHISGLIKGYNDKKMTLRKIHCLSRRDCAVEFPSLTISESALFTSNHPVVNTVARSTKQTIHMIMNWIIFSLNVFKFVLFVLPPSSPRRLTSRMTSFS